MKLSPLFWPIKVKNNKIYILDETRLPEKLIYIKIKDYRQACKAIKEMRTRAVGQVILVLYTFLLVVRQNKKKRNLLPILNKVAQALNSTRPTLSFQYLTDMVLGWARSNRPLEKSILDFLEVLKNKRIQQAEEIVKYIKPGDVILTHCNISGSLPLIAEFCRAQNKGVSFFVTETRPYLQGSRLTAWELKRAGFEVTVITDNMVAHIMQEGKVNMVIVGADHLAQNGDIANKIGTLQIALLARHFNIPFYALCPPASGVKSGKEIKIEIRPDKELLEIKGIRIAPVGVKGYYPAFDITPAYLVTKHFILEVRR